MNDIRAQGDMHGNRNSQTSAGGQETGRAVRKLPLVPVDEMPQGFSDSLAVFCPPYDRVVEHSTGLLRHPETSGVDFGVHLLGGVAHQGEFKVVNDDRSIHGEGCHNAPFHEVDQNGVEPHLYGMGAHADDHGPASAVRMGDGVCDGLEGVSR